MKCKVVSIMLTALMIASGGKSQGILPSVPWDSVTVTTSRPFHSVVSDYMLQYGQNNPNDTSEGGTLRSLSRQLQFLEGRICQNAPLGTPITAPWVTAMTTATSLLTDACAQSAGQFQGNWRCLGPFINTYGEKENSGRAECVWVDRDTPSHILIGAQSGGLWETRNGGQNWVNKTDGAAGIIPATIGVYHIAVSPLNRNIIYINTGIGIRAGNREKGWEYGTGVLYSTDGGQTWQRDIGLSSLLNGTTPSPYNLTTTITKLAFMPGTDKLFAIADNRVVYKASQSSPWTEVTPASMSSLPANYKFSDFEFTSQNSQKVVFVGNAPDVVATNYHRYWTCNHIGQGWNMYTVSVPAPCTLNETSFADISISSNDDIFYLIPRPVGAGTVAQLGKIPLGSTSITHINSNLNEVDRLYVSPSNSDVIYFTKSDGGTSFFKTYNGGLSISNISGLSHADGRDLFIVSSNASGDDDVVGVTDGGVARKLPGATDFSSITGDGLCITQFYGFSEPEDNENTIFGGAQDNGGVSYLKDRADPWKARHPGGDGYLTGFARNGVKHTLIGMNYPSLTQASFTNTDIMFFNYIDPPNDGLSLPPADPAINQHRRIVYSENNRQEIGYYLVWTKEMWETAATDWKRLFEFFPTGHTPMLTNPPDAEDKDIPYNYCRVNKWIIPDIPGYQNYAYILYRNVGSKDLGNGNTIRAREAGAPKYLSKLFRTNALLAPTSGSKTYPVPNAASWADISPGGVGWFAPTDVVINPDNPAELFFSLGDIEWGTVNNPNIVSFDSTKNRIFYSPDFGNTWVDISKGLPALPVTKLVYHRGFNTLYAGTDIGVFKCDFSTYNPTTLVNDVNTSVSWKCFNNGLPAVLVQDMDINYCAGKLRIATFGRGIWETDLLLDQPTSAYPVAGTLDPAPSQVISSSTTWASSKTITTSIRIINNSTLSITGSNTIIRMPYRAKIIVEPGSKLIVDGATITNECNGFWGGICVYGPTLNISQASNAGILEIKNQATIEHALEAVRNWDGSNLNTAGGIIKATSSMFRNNRRSAEFCAYINNGPNGILDDQSSFTGCTFLITDQYKGTLANFAFNTHVSMWSTLGVKFTACYFRNNHSGVFKGEGVGIRSYNAAYTVRAYCNISFPVPCNNPVRSEFIGLRYGIWAEGDANAMPGSVMVNKARFDTVSIGIWSSSVQHISATENLFNIGNGKPINATGCYQNIGMFTINTQQFTIEENTFTGFTNTWQQNGWQNIGLITQHSGEKDKEVYRNTFSSLKYAALALGKNRSNLPAIGIPAIGTGLRYTCNSFTNNEYDICVRGTPAAPYFEGIAPYQGNANSAAGNIFNTPTSYHIENSCMSITYFHAGGLTEPLNVTSAGTGVVYKATGAASKCSSRWTDDGPVSESGSGLSGIKSQFYNAKSSYNQALTEYTSSMDGGDHGALLQYIDSRYPDDAADTRAYLLALSPNVSSSALKALARKSCLPKPMLMEVLRANPEACRDYYFRMFLKDSISNPLSNAQVDSLRLASYVNTNRSRNESILAGYTNEMSEAVNQIITAYKEEDSVKINSDSIDVWLDNSGELWAQYHRIAYCLFTGDLVKGDDLLADIPLNYKLDGEQFKEYGAFSELWSLLKNVQTSGRTILDLTPMEKTYLADVGRNPDAQNIRIMAQSITDFLDPPIEATKACADIRLSPLRQANMIEEAAGTDLITAYPNPANDYVAFDYQVPNASGALRITISSITGEKVATIALSGNIGETWWDCKVIQPGTYLYQLQDEKSILKTGKIVIIK